MNHHHNGIPLVTPIEMPQGETTQYVDCPWCHQRVLLTASRHGTSMQMCAPRSSADSSPI